MVNTFLPLYKVLFNAYIFQNRHYPLYFDISSTYNWNFKFVNCNCKCLLKWILKTPIICTHVRPSVGDNNCIASQFRLVNIFDQMSENRLSLNKHEMNSGCYLAISTKGETYMLTLSPPVGPV